MSHLDRINGYSHLSGDGLEIGALGAPAPLPQGCRVVYCDVLSASEATEYFPELDPLLLVPVDHLLDLDCAGLARFATASQNFVVMNQVIEHVANPIAVIAELFRVTRVGGHVALSASDCRYTCSAQRKTTPFRHLLREYRAGTSDVSDGHYLAYLRGVQPELFERGESSLQAALEVVRRRREPVHVWEAEGFMHFVQRSLDLLGIRAERVYCNNAVAHRSESFSVWRKRETPVPAARLPAAAWLLPRLRRWMSRSQTAA